jgi:hypothetical protein
VQFADRCRVKPSESSSASQRAGKKAKETKEALRDGRSKKVLDDDVARGKFKRAKEVHDRLANESNDDEHGQKRKRPMGKKKKLKLDPDTPDTSSSRRSSLHAPDWQLMM